MKNYKIYSHYKDNVSNGKAELYEKIVSAKLLVIVILVFKCYPIHIIYCFICINF